MEFPKSYRYGKAAHRIAQEFYPSSTKGWYPKGILSVNQSGTVRIDLKQALGIDIALANSSVKVKIGGSSYPNGTLIDNIRYTKLVMNTIYECLYDVSNMTYMMQNTKTSRIDLAYNLYGWESLNDVEIKRQARYTNIRRFNKARITIDQILLAVDRENAGVENFTLHWKDDEELMAITIGKRGGSGVQMIVYLKQYDTDKQRQKAVERHGTDNFAKVEYKVGAEVLKKQGLQVYHRIREKDIMNVWKVCKKRFMPVFNDNKPFSPKFYDLVHKIDNDVQRMEVLNTEVNENNAVYQTVNGMIRKMDEKGLAKVKRMLREAEKVGYSDSVLKKVGNPEG